MERPTSPFSNKTVQTVQVVTIPNPSVQVVGSTNILNETDHLPATMTQATTKALVIPAKTVSEAAILKLGSTSGQTISTISGKILELHKGSDQGEMGDKLNELIKSAKGLSSENFKPGLIGKIMSTFRNTSYDLTHRFETAKGRVDTLVSELEKEKNKQYQTCQNIDALIEGNANYCKSIINEIAEGTQLLESIADEIAAFPDGTVMEPEEARALADARNRYDLLEKKLVDLEGFKVLSMNMDPKLTAMKGSAHSLINTFDMIVTKMVPNYMLVFAQYLTNKDMERAQKLADQTTDAYNEVIKQNGDLTVQNMERIGRLKNRQMISVDVLKEDHEKMITGLNNLRQIEEQARKDRAATIVALRDLEQKTIETFSRK